MDFGWTYITNFISGEKEIFNLTLASQFFWISFQDLCKSCGLVASSAITFIIMFMPKGRQLSAMGKEGVYSEDRTDVYGGTDSSTQSTASCATR